MEPKYYYFEKGKEAASMMLGKTVAATDSSVKHQTRETIQCIAVL